MLQRLVMPAAALGNRLVGQHDAADDLVVMLQRVGEAHGELLEAL
ncbi:MAG TPA: hypothetical protein VF221_21160 [Chloroflexota bacterium]